MMVLVVPTDKQPNHRSDRRSPDHEPPSWAAAELRRQIRHRLRRLKALRDAMGAEGDRELLAAIHDELEVLARLLRTLEILEALEGKRGGKEPGDEPAAGGPPPHADNGSDERTD